MTAAPAAPAATIYHLAGTRRSSTGELHMAEAAAKLDEAVSGIHALQITMARVDATLTQIASSTTDHETRLRNMEPMLPQMVALQARMAAVEARPVGVTARQLWAAVCSGTGAAAALAALVDRLIH